MRYRTRATADVTTAADCRSRPAYRLFFQVVPTLFFHCRNSVWPSQPVVVRVSYTRVRHRGTIFVLRTVFAFSRAQSMKSCATGLSVRFFRVTITFWTCAIGSSTGKIFISERMVGNINTEAGKIVTKRPVAKRLILTSGESAITVVRG